MIHPARVELNEGGSDEGQLCLGFVSFNLRSKFEISSVGCRDVEMSTVFREESATRLFISCKVWLLVRA